MNSKRSLFFHFSNRWEHLFNLFVEEIAQLKPFEKVWVVVPSKASKQRLSSLLSDRLGICMGIEFLTLQPAIYQILDLFFSDESMPKHLELSLRIQKAVIEKIEEASFKSVHDYLTDQSATIDQKRLVALCDHLASQFVTYSLYVPTLEKQWKGSFIGHWQQHIWEEVFSGVKAPSFFASKEINQSASAFKMLFFNFSFMPQAYFDLIGKVSQKAPISFFQLSGCQHFWSDLQTKQDKRNWLRQLKSRGVDSAQIDELSHYLTNSHPLLANLGKLNRGWLKQIEESDVVTQEHYEISQHFTSFKAYQPHLVLDQLSLNQESTSLLRAVQADMLLLRDSQEKIEYRPCHSIQIHQAPSISREVEILYNQLTEMIHQNPSIQPSDIVVYVADIERYIPHIESVFQSSSSSIPVQIEDYPFKVRNSTLKVLFALLEIDLHNWEPQHVFEIFHHRAFMKRFNLNSEIISQWHALTHELGPILGYDRSSLNQHLEARYQTKDFSNQAMYCWQDIFDILIKYYCEQQKTCALIPFLEFADFTSFDTFNLLVEILQSLNDDLTFLKSEKLSFAGWAERLEAIFSRYFYFEGQDQKEFQKIVDIVRSFETHDFSLENDVFDFQTFFYYFKKECVDAQQSNRSFEQESVSFYSLFNASAQRSKVSCLLGINDLTYPRLSVEHPLSLMAEFDHTLYCPPISDYDRHLFLEILWSTCDVLYMSYLGYCTETFKEVQPSIIITELLNYLEQYYDFGDQNVDELLVKKHPHLSFDRSYFKDENFQSKNFPLAKSYYQLSKTQSKQGLDFFNPRLEQKIEARANVISIEKLFSLCKDPLMYGLKNLYGMDLQPFELHHRHQNMSLSALQKALMKKELFSTTDIECSEALPKGHYKLLAHEEFEKNRLEMRSFLNEHNLSFENLLTLELRQDISKLCMHKQNVLLAPALKIEVVDQTIELVGSLSFISEKGYISLNSTSLKTRFEEYVKYLVYLTLNQRYQTGFDHQWIFAFSSTSVCPSIEDPSIELARYIQYYLQAQKKIYPFMPAWIAHFLTLEPTKVREHIRKDLHSSYFYSSYAKALFKQFDLNDLPIENWQQEAKNFFQNTYEQIKT